MRTNRLIHSKLLKACLLIVGICLFLWSVTISYERQKLKTESHLKSYLTATVKDLNNEIIKSTETLHSLASLFKTISPVTKDIFEKFTSSLSSKKNASLLIEWQPLVLEKDKKTFSIYARKLGVKNFKMLEPTKDGKFINAKKRKEHFPVLFSYSTIGQKSTVGLDLSWSKERMRSKLLARDQGVPVASNSFEVFLTEGSRKSKLGFAITLPVYNQRVETKDERIKHLKGFLAAVFYVKELVAPSLAKLEAHNIGYKITDLANKKTLVDKKFDIYQKISKSETINVYGQKWKIEVFADASLVGKYINISEFIIPTVLLLFIIFLFYGLAFIEVKNTELANARMRLEKALSDAKGAARSKMRFLANMSHEIRTPIHSILGFTSLLQQEKNEKVRKDYTDRMVNSGKHLLSLIDDILEVSSLEKSEVHIKNEPFSLSKLLDEVEDIIQVKIKNNIGVDFKIIRHIDYDVVLGDALRIKQVIINLLGNSFKFTKSGYISLECEACFVDSNCLDVKFYIRDSGIGINEKYLAEATEAFTQEDDTFSRKVGGAGLGLSIVRSLIEKMNGSLLIDSKKNQGTLIIVDLKLKKDHLPIKDYIDDNSKTEKILTEKSILIAEDDSDSRLLLEVFLQSQNLKLTFVKNGKELLSKLNNEKFDLILTDIQMPELDGLEATKILRAKGVEIPILAMTAHTLQEEKEKILRSGITDYISKPLDENGLRKFLIKYLI